jgi:hypothetical protein
MRINRFKRRPYTKAPASWLAGASEVSVDDD